jgi:hypothetical protein
MKCPRCSETLPFVLCKECQGEIPEGSLYCCRCGHPVKRETVEAKVDFSERTLCSDGNCIGVINEQGICNVCGKAYSGETA